MAVELYLVARIQFGLDVNACFLLDFPRSALVGKFVLVPLTFGEAPLGPDSDDENLGVVGVEDDGATYGLVFDHFGDELRWVDLEESGAVLLQFVEEVAALFVPISEILLGEDLVDVVVEGLLGMIAEPVGVLLLFLGQVQQKFAQYALEQLPLFVHLNDHRSITISNLTTIHPHPLSPAENPHCLARHKLHSHTL